MMAATRRHYFDEAMRQLGVAGFKGVTISSITAALGVTSGSFYHHFGNWNGFVEGLLADWRQQQTDQIIQLVEATDDNPRVQWDELIQLAVAVPHDAEAAIRAWADNEPTVARAQRGVDAERLRYLETLLTRLVGDEHRARTLATVVLAAYVGLELLGRDLGNDDAAAALLALGDLVRADSERPTAI
jgi:AcrR family transcriptional regulator